MKVPVRLVLLLLAATPALAWAVHPQVREGFGISLGLGGGTGVLKCADCGDRRKGSAGYFRIGGYVRPDMFYGFESSGYYDRHGNDTTGRFYAGAIQWYPSPAHGFHVKGSLGIAAFLSDSGSDNTTYRALGIGVGAGYDVRVGRNFSLTPFLNLVASGKKQVKFGGDPTGMKGTFSFAQMGIGFTWH